MKILWILFFSVATSGFDVGKEYVYKQKGTLHIANPEQPLQSAGVGFRSKIVVQPKEHHTIFSIVGFEAETFNSESIDVTHHQFKYVRNEEAVGALQRPFAATFDEGKVDEIQMDKNEPLWVRNMKKGVLSLFQLDLVKGRHKKPDDRDYHVKEDGLHGSCDTLYIVHKEDHGHIEVTKVKNLDKCDDGNYATYGRQKGTVCVKCEAQRTYQLADTSEVYYRLKGTAQRYVIEHAWSESTQMLRSNNEGKEVRVIFNRTLDFETEGEITEELSLPREIQKERSLAQQFSVTPDFKDPQDLKHVNGFITYFSLRAIKEHLVLSLQALARLEYTNEDIRDIDDEYSGALFFLIAFHSLSTFEYDEIDDVYRNHVLTASENKDSMRHVFLDLLGATGGNRHVAYGLSLIKSGELSNLDAHHFYSKIQINLKEASTAMIHEISDSCKSEAVKSHRRTWSSCKLAASAIAGGSGCQHAKEDQEEDKGTCSPEIVSRFFNYSVMPGDVEHETDHQSTVFLSVAGNLGTRKAVEYLERFIRPKWHASEQKRMAALWALRQAAKHQPKLARSAAMPVFHNTSEPSEIRIAAFLVVLETDPELYILRHIGLEMITEPSDQLVAFVSSAFRSLAESEYPCNREISQHLRYVLPLWDNHSRFREPIDGSSSQMFISSGYNRKYDYGGMTQIEMIRSRDSYLPRNLQVSMKDYMAGHTHDTMAVSFESWGMDKLLNHLVGPQPGSTKNIWNFMGRRRFPRDASVDERGHIDDALPIAVREYDPAYARLSLSLFGQTIDTWEFDESLLDVMNSKVTPEKAAEKPAGSGGRKVFSLTQDWTFLMPTELGIPLSFDHKQADFIYANRQSPNDIMNGDNGEMNFNVKGHYLYETRSYQMFALPLSFTNATVGASYDARTVISWPLDLRVTLNAAEGKLSLRRPVHLPWNVANHYFHPYTFNMPFETRVSINLDDLLNMQKPLYKPEELTQFDRKYFDEAYGVNLAVKGHLLSKGLQRGLRDFSNMTWREQLYYVTINPNWHPRDVKIYLKPAAEGPTKEVDVDMSYKFFESGEARNSHFNAHDQIGDEPGLPATHVVNVDVNLKGEANERKTTAELRYSFDHDLFNHKLQLFYERTPFSKVEREGMKVCVDVSTNFPKPDWSRFHNLPTFYQGQQVNASLDLHYGSSCEGQSRITIKGKFTHTDDDERQLTAAVQGTPLGRGHLSNGFLQKLARKCKASQENGIEFSVDCFKLLRHSSRFGKFTADVEYANYTPLYRRLFPFQALYPALHPPEDPFLRVLRLNFKGKNGKLHLVSQVPWRGPKETLVSDITVTREDGHTVEYHGVPLLNHVLEPTVFAEMGHTNMEYYSSLYKHGYCGLQSLSVHTFDGTVVELPQTDCYAVVSRDCSQNKRFLVLARATNNPTLTKALKVFIDTTKVEILPGTEDSSLVLSVDGTTLETTPERPYRHAYHDAELFRIVKSEKTWFALVSESYGVYLVFNGNMLFVQVAPFYRGKLCGLCGDYNLDRNHELTGPDGRLYNSTLEFAKSYVVPSSDCKPPSQ
ncbi:vitellogenin-6-like [Dermacentor albipictus]|uniref:vitellogenin-6-like n=1 Tax=Dermacentor albipictus TaxID=60249 RepID=UPI0031FCB370